MRITYKQWARNLIAMGITTAQLDRATCIVYRFNPYWLSKSQRNRLRRIFRQELT